MPGQRTLEFRAYFSPLQISFFHISNFDANCQHSIREKKLNFQTSQNGRSFTAYQFKMATYPRPRVENLLMTTLGARTLKITLCNKRMTRRQSINNSHSQPILHCSDIKSNSQPENTNFFSQLIFASAQIETKIDKFRNSLCWLLPLTSSTMPSALSL